MKIVCDNCSAELKDIQCLYCGTIDIKKRNSFLRMKLVSLLEGPKPFKSILELPPPPKNFNAYGHGMIWF